MDNHATDEQARESRRRATILERPDMLTVQQLAERFGLPRPLLDKRHAAGKLLALRLEGKRRYRYPAWQGRMVTDDTSRKAFEAVLGVIGAGDPWSVYGFFTTPSTRLAGKTPVECWKRRTAEDILRAAEEWAAGGSLADAIPEFSGVRVARREQI